jgi:hypothetical protein
MRNFDIGILDLIRAGNIVQRQVGQGNLLRKFCSNPSLVRPQLIWESEIFSIMSISSKTKLNPVASVSELTTPTEPLVGEDSVNFCGYRGCHVVSVTDPYGRILDFLDRSRYFFFQVAPQLYSESWVDPVPDPLLLRKSGSADYRTRASFH